MDGNEVSVSFMRDVGACTIALLFHNIPCILLIQCITTVHGQVQAVLSASNHAAEF